MSNTPASMRPPLEECEFQPTDADFEHQRNGRAAEDYRSLAQALLDGRTLSRFAGNELGQPPAGRERARARGEQ